MTTENGNGMIMPVSPLYGNGGNAGWGGFGGDWGSLIVLFLIAAMFGGFGGGFGGFGGGFNGGLGIDFPWLLNANNNTDSLVTAGFNQAATASTLSGIQSAITSGFGDVQTALCGGFAGVNATVNGAQNAIAQQLYTNQIADLERSFAAQTASTQGMSNIQSQLAQCCCDNRLATANLSALVQSENCQDRFVAQQNTRDIIEAQNRGNQAILDKLCALELDGYKRENDNLRTQLNMAALGASQTAQTATIQAGQRALASEVEQYVNPTPIPAYVVQNPNCCTPNYGCGCGSF
jgi:hypothetical protein